MTRPKFKIKKGDEVQVITGKNKGRRGTVSKVLRDEGKVIVKDVNVVTRNMKQSYFHPQGRFEKEMPIHISNVALIDPSVDKPAKIGYKLEEGKKIRYFKKSGVRI
ncbi:MAG: 50S ribosomal protein L24 [Holosporales bacterium]|jgi:large subunit ribosomal protein L24|nr:50S ribosomal protein L24 [Holosporales bacterium]